MEKKTRIHIIIISILAVLFSCIFCAIKENDTSNFVLNKSKTLRPDVLLNDAVTIPGVDALFPEGEPKILQVPIIKGDAKSASIAAASILAKVSRDRYMMELDQRYPQYQFAKHKGYPTAVHYQAIRENGSSPVHRLTLLKKMH